MEIQVPYHIVWFIKIWSLFVSCLFTFLRMSFETQKFNFDDVQFVYFFFCCLCIPDLSPLPLLLSPYIPSSGFWLGQPVVVPGTGSPSPSVLSSIEPCPALVIHSLIPISHSGSLLYRGWRQQPTGQPPLLQLLPCSVHPMCSCQTHQPSGLPVEWPPPLPAQVQLVLQGSSELIFLLLCR